MKLRSLKTLLLFLVLLVWAVMALPDNNAPKPVVASGPTPSLLNKINKIRAEAGKPPLVEDLRLSASAKEKAKDLVDRGYWSHDTPDGESFSLVILKHSPDINGAGENLVKCHKNEDHALEGWVKSPAHYQNIVGHWKYWGSGEYESKDCKYLVNHFSR